MIDFVNEKGQELCFYSFVETVCVPVFGGMWKDCSGCGRVEHLEKYRKRLSEFKENEEKHRGMEETTN